MTLRRDTQPPASTAAVVALTADPMAALRQRSIGILAWSNPLVVGARRVLGVWDPVLRRIELFEVTPQRPARELVATLLHEAAHALGQDDETSTRQLAEAASAALSDDQAARIAADLVAVARTRETTPAALAADERLTPLSFPA